MARTFFGVSLALGSALELLLGPATELVVTSCHIKPTFCHTSQSNQEMFFLLRRIREDDISKMMIFLNFQLAHEALTRLFTSPVSFKCWMVDVECFANFSYSPKRIRFDDPLSWSLSPSDDWPLCFSSSKLSFAKLLELSLHCALISSSWARCVADVASCLCCFTTHFELE